jgi:hypothetical protein
MSQLVLCDAIVAKQLAGNIKDMVVVNGILVFPGESPEITKPPILLPDALQCMKRLFRYKMKRKVEVEESDDEVSVHDSSSSSESDEEESELESEEEIASDDD